MDMAAGVILVVLAVIGAAAVVRELALRLFCGREDGTVMLITRIPAKSGSAEQVLRSALARQRWRGGAVSKVCLDMPMEERTRRICEGICREYGYETLLTKEEFLKSLDY